MLLLLLLVDESLSSFLLSASAGLPAMSRSASSYWGSLSAGVWMLRSSGLKVRRAQVSLRRVEWLKSLEYPKTELKSGKVMRLLW